MTVMAKVQRRDRWADWAVILFVVVALVIGLVLRSSVLYRTTPFTLSESGISGEAPTGWVSREGDATLLRLRNPVGRTFDTRLEVRSQPLADEAAPGLALDAIALERANDVTAYQTLNTDAVLVDGKATPRRVFTYVETNPNPYLDNLPVVVRGTDIALRDEGRVIVVTFLADTENFYADYPFFLAFIESLEY
ncbi:MAG: hypothetical protein ACP5GX_02275 [Anaerolineae bacterium]